ncbi:hypothetical protein GPECTOR_15g501 [Gonium pectorale]|uniref:Uncharacterized protein n=1 Tax=Gonium pectorale TaxID=33097 RepID=A0A150GM40_GONPE|nr:hypothetical protein GPECTOR_15g501 [Gonium pectorale]|eukprot:KXZ50815.1 hypothetical protein GPECTOR_15g501 [Gonium pectorale]
MTRARPEKSSTDEMKGGLDPYLEVAVPKDQRPINQLTELKQDPLYSWYDGEMFVKPPEVLMRDRLLGTYEVKPVLAKLRSTLLGSAGVLLASAVLLFGLIRAGSDADGMYGRGAARVPRQVLADGVLYSPRVSDLNQLATDDDAAAAEAEAQGSVPGYCGDRALRAYAGGQYCAKFDR